MDLPTYNAELSGTGAIAQGQNAVAGGEDALVVGGNIQAENLTIIMGADAGHGGSTLTKQNLAARKPPPLRYALLFNRQTQDGGNDTRIGIQHALKRAMDSGRRIVPIILPGPEDEAPDDYTERFAIYTLRRFCQRHTLDYKVDLKPPLSWPMPDGSEEDRFQELVSDLGTMIGKPAISVTELQGSPGINEEGQLANWLHNGKRHVVLVYHLYGHQICRHDAKLILRWIDFWKQVEYKSDNNFVTVFFCLHSGLSWYSRLFGRSESCLRKLKDSLAKDPHVAVIKPLEPVSDKDVGPWANTCKQAWDLESEGKPYPLNNTKLKTKADEAFDQTKRLPYAKLKLQLEDAITHAHIG